MRYRAVNWIDEGYCETYGDDNNGFIYGVYVYDDEDDFPLDVSWFKDEDTRDLAIKESEALDRV